MRHVTPAQYREAFGIDPPNASKRKRALAHALDIRKFEIELYWRRAAYFWTFIGASLAAYGALQAGTVHNRRQLTIVVGALGLVFSFAWFCVNRGSKRWQENWENHVDMLEDGVIGPLYKTVAGRPPISDNIELGSRPRRYVAHALTGPSPLSVSKINQIVSAFVTILWIPLIYLAARPFDWSADIDWFATIVLTTAVVTCGLITWLGRSDSIDYSFVAVRRASGIRPVKQPNPPLQPTSGGDAEAARD